MDIKDKKGYLLPMVLIFIVVSILMGMAVLYIGELESIGAAKRLYREKAFYLAEAGAYRAYAHLKEDDGWDPGEEPVPLGEGTFLVAIEDESGDTVITSTGAFKSVSETVQLTISSGSGGNIWAQGLFGSERIKMSNNARIAGYDSTSDPGAGIELENAEAGSIYLIQMSNNSTIKGNASVTEEGEITLHNNSIVTGSQNPSGSFDEPLNDLPDVVIPSDLLASPYPVKDDFSYTGSQWGWGITNGALGVWNNNVALEIHGGNYRFKSISFSNGLIRFTGNSRIYVENAVNISNNSKVSIEGSVVFYLGENSTMSVSNNAKIGNVQSVAPPVILPISPSDLRIYSASSSYNAINFSNNSKIAGLIYAPSGRVDLNNNVRFLGGIVTDILDISNNAKAIYDISLAGTEIPDDPGGGGGTGGLEIIRWTKPGWSNRLQ